MHGLSCSVDGRTSWSKSKDNQTRSVLEILPRYSDAKTRHSRIGSRDCLEVYISVYYYRHEQV
jgi:hypothetical protein